MPIDPVELHIAKSWPNDSGHGRARLHPAVTSRLGLQSGDPITVDGAQGDRAALRAYASDPDDSNSVDPTDDDPSAIRLDGFTRVTIDAALGDRVMVRKTSPQPATRVVVERPADATPDLYPSADAIVSQLRGLLVVCDQCVCVIWRRSPDGQQGSGLFVTETDPDGPVLITDGTTISLPDEYE